ncbi:LytTr DNA-binding domain-containing protein [Cyclobacterium xiamenense]|uniref:LytTr DNA-binding domain-containing protein n=1 Tax=Cyclobacterium xiamenense TaxID=1297121 RepID=A0A1H6ZFG3_9BACT|nr:LytTR family DNA-binding domain-containing protein [Cyclobacterium xiamenense]SEJ52303.1 LytTr DNA-binding domain-containing protein [Cyclobacterium xiamenense]
MDKVFSRSMVKTFTKKHFYRLFPLALGLISGFSVFYFLFFFGAYGIQKGISYSGHSHLFRSISFGVLTFMYLTAFETWMKPKLNITRLSHSIIWYIGLLIIGSQLIFLLFNFFWNWQEWNVEAYLLIVKEFPLLMALPLSFYLVLIALIKPNIIKEEYLLFQSENDKDQLKVRLQDFMYANSSENYITIFYTSNSKSMQHLIRKPLKVLEQELNAYPEVKRIHRSYLLNSRNIQAVKQLKTKVFVEMNGTSLPVSKQFQKHFLD